ncbi:MAG: hypothetical protein JWQ96_2706 [Segetibacter sp.]|nr:hypothetical protein [Segetibacter sp.]
MTEANLLVKATSIVTHCTGNNYFTDIQTTVTAVGAARTAYGSALDAAKTGDKTSIAIKDAKKLELIVWLRKLVDQVSAIASGDLVILKSSDIPLAKDREPSPLLTKPNPPILSAGFNLGEVTSEGASGKGIKATMHMITPDPLTSESVWRSVVTTSRKHTFTNLESGKRSWYKQALVGVKDQYVESDPVSYIAQ